MKRTLEEKGNCLHCKSNSWERLEGKAVPGNETNVLEGHCQRMSTGKTARDPRSKEACSTAEGLWLPQKQSKWQLGVLSEKRNNLLTCENNILPIVVRILFKERKVQAERPMRDNPNNSGRHWDGSLKSEERLSKVLVDPMLLVLPMCLRQRHLCVRGTDVEAEMNRGVY